MKLHNTLNAALWDSLVSDLSQPYFHRFINSLRDIRDTIRLLQPSVIQQIDAVLPMDTIRNRCEKGLYDWKSVRAMMTSIFNVIRGVMNPKRYDEARARWKDLSRGMERAQFETFDQARVLCKTLEYIHSMCTQMRLDIANEKLQSLSKVIAEHGDVHELEKFKLRLACGQILSKELRFFFLSLFLFFSFSLFLCYTLAYASVL